MLLDPDGWALTAAIDTVLPGLSHGLAAHVGAETHGSALELRSGVHGTRRRRGSPSCTASAPSSRVELDRSACAPPPPACTRSPSGRTRGSQPASATGCSTDRCASSPAASRPSPSTSTSPSPIPRTPCARSTGCAPICPLLLALSANSPYWQGRDTGLASARTPLFQAFPRVGIPRAFADYGDYVEAIDLLLRCDAFPEPTFLWWDVRLQPRFGTIEVRIMDAQTTTADSAGLVALVQSLVRLEVEEGFAAADLVGAPEVLDENRFLAARDGIEAELIVPAAGRRIPARDAARRDARRLPAPRRGRSAARPSSTESGSSQRPARPRPADVRRRRARRPRRPGRGARRRVHLTPGNSPHGRAASGRA